MQSFNDRHGDPPFAPIRHLLASAGLRIREKLSDLKAALNMPVYWGCCPNHHAGPAWIFMPYTPHRLCCGLAGLISVKRAQAPNDLQAVATFDKTIETIRTHALKACLDRDAAIAGQYLGGDQLLETIYDQTCLLKQEAPFLHLFTREGQQAQLKALCEQLNDLIEHEVRALQNQIGYLSAADAEIIDRRIEKIKDIAWCLKVELLDNISKTKGLMGDGDFARSVEAVKIFRNLNTVLNSIDRLEVRGRDSAGISLLFLFEQNDFASIEKALSNAGLSEQIESRSAKETLGNLSISIGQHTEAGLKGITLTYKVAAEIGSLGDNVRKLREAIAADPVLHLVARQPNSYHTISAHTRWASVGAITIANCHPVDNATCGAKSGSKGMIHACLNGDIDNYLSLKQQWEQIGGAIPEEITTDTKIIPLQIEYYLRQGHPIEEAFRLAVSDFEGSHAIAMHTDLAPGKFFLAQRGSGQAVFVGLARDHYLPTSEVYGFVEQTSDYIRLNGEKVVEGANGPTQGQIFILDQNRSDRALDAV